MELGVAIISPAAPCTGHSHSNQSQITQVEYPMHSARNGPSAPISLSSVLQYLKLTKSEIGFLKIMAAKIVCTQAFGWHSSY